jgi:hypothetical protein
MKGKGLMMRIDVGGWGDTVDGSNAALKGTRPDVSG